MGKPLTAELIAQKTKNDQLFAIKNLNLWGNDIDDLKILRQLPNLEVLSLSVNKVKTLKDIACCSKLKELYLRKNLISDIKELRHLVSLPQLQVLWLQDNPCADIPNYREIVIKHLPNLIKLDNTSITPEDRQQSQNVILDFEELESPPQPQQNAQNYAHFSRPKSMQKESPIKVHKPITPEKRPNQERDENILCAVLALVKELDDNSLEVVKRDIERKLAQKKRYL